MVPNGVATGLDIGFSNYSLVFITLSFYVMCKSTTPLFLLAFAIAWGIERPSWPLAGVVAVISAGLLLLVAGETKFDLVGFLLVMTAAMLSGLRWTITQVLLQGRPGSAGAGAHGSPVEVLYQLTPIMGITLLLLSLAHERLWATLPGSPYFEGVWHTLLTGAITLAGGVIAFLMVLAEFTLIANTSALTFMVAGTFKEIVTGGPAGLRPCLHTSTQPPWRLHGRSAHLLPPSDTPPGVAHLPPWSAYPCPHPNYTCPCPCPAHTCPCPPSPQTLPLPLPPQLARRCSSCTSASPGSTRWAWWSSSGAWCCSTTGSGAA